MVQDPSVGGLDTNSQLRGTQRMGLAAQKLGDEGLGMKKAFYPHCHAGLPLWEL
jgi:hypothetical protein